jgi:DNA ligase-associated metallophosphoesterase
MSAIRLRRCGETLLLRPDGSLLLEERRALLAADLHLGKAATFAAAGLPAPGGTLEADLRRLAAAVRETGCATVYVLGDLLHHPSGTGEALRARVAAWREEVTVPLTVVPGNHDRNLAGLAAGWRLEVAGRELWLGPFRLRHRATRAGTDAGAHEGNPCSGAPCLEIVGHEHPVVRLRAGGDDLRLRCFAEEAGRLTLPAFSSFAGGAEVDPAGGRWVYALADGAVVDLSGSRI